MSARRIFCAIAIVSMTLCGCGDSQVKAVSASDLKTTSEPLSDAELQRFLRLISRLPDGQVPEFTPNDQPQLDTLLPPKVLVSEFRSRYRQLCDPVRQGEHWDASLDLSKSTQQEGWTSAQLAAFIRCLSCAVMKSELTKKHDLKAIEQDCRQEITKLVKSLELDDQRPRSSMTEAFMQQRELKVRRLGRMVALLEFMLQLKPIPPSNLELVQKYSTQITALLPETTTQDPFVDPFADESVTEGAVDPGVVPVNYEQKRS